MNLPDGDITAIVKNSRGKKIMSKRVKRALSALLAFALVLGGGGSTVVQAGSEPAEPPMVLMEVFSESGLIETIELPETDAYQEPPEGYPAAAPPNFEVEKIIDNGPDANKIVLTILGDGFTAAEQDAFVASAAEVSNYLLNKHPYSAFRDVFNVYAVKVVSNESGAAETQGASVDNYFGSKFYYDGETERLLYAGYNTKVYDVLNRCTPNYDIPVVLVNSTKYGGGGGDYATVSCHSDANEILVHELGHSVGGLADEYWYRGREAANMTATNNPQTVKWNTWMGVESVGIYAFTENPSWHRPHNNCEMRYLNRSFCEVCATELTRILASKSTKDFFGRSTLTQTNTADGAARIGNYSYYGCELLQTITIPNSVTSIGRYAFLRCTNLSDIMNYATTPQNITGNNVFYGVDRSKVTLSVPPGTTASYEAAGWTGFKEIVETLSVAKAAKIAQINAVTNGLNAADYTAVSWQALQTAISKAVAAVGAAATIEAVNAVVIPGTSGLIRVYSLTLNANKGQVSPQTVTQIAGSTYTLPAPVRSGYTFAGWTLTGGGTLNGNTYTFGTSNGTVTAQWTENSKPPAKGIFGTNAKWHGAWWHYLLFFAGFGFLWMWF